MAEFTRPQAALLVLDEIQKIPGWSETVKRLWDEDTQADRARHFGGFAEHADALRALGDDEIDLAAVDVARQKYSRVFLLPGEKTRQSPMTFSAAAPSPN